MSIVPNDTSFLCLFNANNLLKDNYLLERERERERENNIDTRIGTRTVYFCAVHKLKNKFPEKHSLNFLFFNVSSCHEMLGTNIRHDRGTYLRKMKIRGRSTFF
jgi:hypothetical protein